MSAHDWPDFDIFKGVLLAAGEDYAIISEAKYNRARLCVNYLAAFTDDQIESGIDLVAMVKELDELRLRNAALEQQFHAADGRYSSQKRHNEKLQAALDVERATNTKHVTLLEQQLEEIKKGLTDSATVYANMLRGIIATPREFEHRAEQIATLEQQRWELVDIAHECQKIIKELCACYSHHEPIATLERIEAIKQVQP